MRDMSASEKTCFCVFHRTGPLIVSGKIPAGKIFLGRDEQLVAKQSFA
jgi:hypothetical protein